MENINYDSVLILALFAFITPLFISAFKKYKIPFVVGELFIGIIIGKSFLNLIHVDPWIDFLSNLGLAYLMFLSGLEIDVHSIKVGKSKKATGYNYVLLCVIMCLISIGISFVICKILYSFGLIKSVWFMTFLLSASAPGFLVPFLKEKGILKTQYGQILLIYSLLAEFTSLIAMTVISSKISYGLSYKSFLFLVIILSSFLIYIILKRFQNKYDFSVFLGNDMHIEVRAAFALMLILVTISHKVGTEIALGSFLAGVIFTFLTDKSREEDLKYKLDIIGYGFLIPIFFIMVGVKLDISSILTSPKYLLSIPIILIIIYVIKLIPSLLLKYKYGLNKTISASFILSSQLSVMIVGDQIAFNLKLINTELYSTLILTTVISCLLFPLIFNKILKTDNFKELNKFDVKKIYIREVVPLNKDIFNKPLMDVKFPFGCRILLILRDTEKIIPNGNSTILEGDVLVIAGFGEESSKFISMLQSS
ncbi:cation:proton antiporter [Clostridium oceanicum]|uniref:Cation:proton antiporter n=1 Tax=Clostridium oceanicum TaxID=1543 RepID=A0ABP3UVJ1_9CLOT